MTLDVKVEVQEAVAGLKEMGFEIPNAMKVMLSSIARAARDRVKDRMGAFLQLNRMASTSGGAILTGRKGKPQKGTLQRRVYGYSRSKTHWVVAAPRYIAEPLEKGATIHPKTGKHLQFMGREGFRRLKSVTIPAKHWFTRSIDGFEGSSAPTEAINAAEERLIKKFNFARASGAEK